MNQKHFEGHPHTADQFNATGELPTSRGAPGTGLFIDMRALQTLSKARQTTKYGQQNHLASQNKYDPNPFLLASTFLPTKADLGSWFCFAKREGHVAAQRCERVAQHGAAAANELGLTVPVREVSGRSRSLKLGAQLIELRHVPAWQLVLLGRLAGAAIRALAWLGPKRANEALRKFQQKLAPSELQAVIGARGRLPTWMAQEVSTLANSG